MLKLNRIEFLAVLSLLLFGCAGSPAISADPLAQPPPTATPFSPGADFTATQPAVPAPTFAPGGLSSGGGPLRDAEYALQKGDWSSAKAQFMQALNEGIEPDRAAFGLARAFLSEGDSSSARAWLETLLAADPRADYRALANILLGDIAAGQKDWNTAAEFYQRYLLLGHGGLDSPVQEHFADALYASGQYSAAAQSFAYAVSAAGASDRPRLMEKEADALLAGGMPDAAIAQYDRILPETASAFALARLHRKVGAIHLAHQRPDNGYARYLSALQYPSTYDAYLCLVELLDAGYTVDELLRGTIDYYAGQHDAAVLAFSRYLSASPADPARAFYLRGLSYSALGQKDSALMDLQTAIGYGAESGVWERASFAAAEIQWNSVGDFAGAAQTLTVLADSAPTNPRAAEALFRAGRIAEIGGDLPTAAAVWQRAATDYPALVYGVDAQHFAGITLYRLGDYGGAENAFAALTNSVITETQARAWLWVAKARRARGEEGGARQAFEQAAAADPTGYYSLRAADILSGASPFENPAQLSLEYNLDAEYLDAQEWVLHTFYANATPDPGRDVFQPAREDSRMAKGILLWKLGWVSEAQSVLDELRTALASDPAGSLYLSRQLVEIGYYPGAIFAARQVLDAARMTDVQTLQALPYFSHVRFGAYYADLLLPAAQKHELNPLLLFSLVRQESLFGGNATSASSAHGLMQLLPATADDTAKRIGLGELAPSDLYRPVINAQLGSAYLAQQLGLFDNNFYSALSAYNGGPGNTLQWRLLAPSDDDLYLEIIRYDETRLYIRRIYELHAIYQSLYGED